MQISVGSSSWHSGVFIWLLMHSFEQQTVVAEKMIKIENSKLILCTVIPQLSSSYGLNSKSRSTLGEVFPLHSGRSFLLGVNV